jgi:PAS domain S-box-containing protein
LSQGNLSAAPQKKRSIGGRFRNNNFLLIMLSFTVVILVAVALLDGMTKMMSKEFAKFYASETVEKFDLYLSNEIELVEKIARSKELIQWFADEANPEKKAEAYKKIRGYADIISGNDFYLGIQGSLHEYAVSPEAAFEYFKPFENPLNPDLPADHWYFSCLKHPREYELNLDTDKYLLRKRLWINHKVIDKGVTLGQVCSGIYFEEVMETLFGDFDREHIRGLVINKEGLVQMDSNLIRREGEPFDPLIEEDTKLSIYEALPHSELIPVLDPYLESIEGYFDSRIDPKVVELSSGPYPYMAIAPIRYSDWSVITLFKSNPLFNVTVLLPLILALLSLFIIYIIANTHFVRKLMILPLNLLIGSLGKAEAEEAPIYGLDRADELGDLARTIQHSLIRIRNEEERSRLLLEALPICASFWDEYLNFVDCNEETLKFFGLKDKKEFGQRFYELSPKYQPDGQLSSEMIPQKFTAALREGRIRFEWMHQAPDGTLLPAEIVLNRVKYGDRYLISAYNWDLRDHKRMMSPLDLE